MSKPPKYKTVEELQAKIDEYFENPPTREVVAKGFIVNVPCCTIYGLVLHLGFCDRASFYDMEKRPIFTHTIKSARSRLKNEYEKNLHSPYAAGSIFALKNFGWTDKQDITTNGQAVKGVQIVVNSEADAKCLGTIADKFGKADENNENVLPPHHGLV